jgi:uncharacterized protein (TIGR03790 family)
LQSKMFRAWLIVSSTALLSACATGGNSPQTTIPAARAASPTTAAGVGRVSPQEVLLLVNDSSPTSVALGNEYAALRHVTNVLHVNCVDSATSQDNETIQYGVFASAIERPVRQFLAAHQEVNFVVVTKGIPIRVVGGTTGEADGGGGARASLDSTIAAFGYDHIQGAVKVRFRDPSGYAVGSAWLNRYWNQHARFSHAAFGGYLVTRLDGYTGREAQALTRRAIAAETNLSNGEILLDIEPDFGIGNPHSEPMPIPSPLIKHEDPYDTWNADMVHAGSDLKARHIPVDADITTTFAVGQGLLGYFSWGSNDDHFSHAVYRSLTFAPGAVGDTAVSTSARSFFPQSSGQSMIADLIRQGITGVKGYTDEPLLQGISSPTIVLGRYTRGYTLAESFYAGSHFVGWTDIVIGDPMSQPYSVLPTRR